MTPSAFIQQLKSNPPGPVYLFLGSETYRRGVCKNALIKRALPEEERERGLTRHDLEETPLRDVIDDARSLSLFAPNRVIWVVAAEAAMPRGRATASNSPGQAALADYVADPSPSVVLVLEAGRHALEGEGKRKAERVRKFYSAIAAEQVVEFPPYRPPDAERLAGELARRAGLKIAPADLGFLAEAVGYDATRIYTEIQKLVLFAGEGKEIGAAEIAQLVPSARAATIFELVAALGRGDRRAALELLDTLVQEGEYLPLALSFLETQFRHALVAREMGLRDPRQIETYFKQAGVRIWFKKAGEIHQTARAFSASQLKSAVANIHAADEGLRSARPDDRTIMEQLVLGLKES